MKSESIVASSDKPCNSSSLAATSCSCSRRDSWVTLRDTDVTPWGCSVVLGPVWRAVGADLKVAGSREQGTAGTMLNESLLLRNDVAGLVICVVICSGREREAQTGEAEDGSNHTTNKS